MRWDRSHESSDVDDLRGASTGRGAGFPLLGAIALGSRWGWKGVLLALLVIGGLTYGSNWCQSASGPVQHGSSSAVDRNATATNDELGKVVGFVFDDVQASWARQLPGYEKTRLGLFTDAIDS